jgi:hypothetical protein
MGFLDKVKAGVKSGAEQAATRAQVEIDRLQAKRDLQQAYADLGEKALGLADAASCPTPSSSPQSTGRVPPRPTSTRSAVSPTLLLQPRSRARRRLRKRRRRVSLQESLDRGIEADPPLAELQRQGNRG